MVTSQTAVSPSTSATSHSSFSRPMSSSFQAGTAGSAGPGNDSRLARAASENRARSTGLRSRAAASRLTVPR